MKKGAIWYNNVWAMPGSELHGLLEEANKTSNPKDKKELMEKAAKSDKESTDRYKKLTGIK